jgi:hypothetical protein
MDRRVLLSALGVGLATAAAGCLGGGTPPADDGGDGPDDSGDGPATDDDTPRRIAEASLTGTGRCDSPGTASVTVGNGVATVTGCAHGRNGCAVPVLGDASYTPDADRLTVVVTSEVRRGEDEACTEALLPLGYEVRVALDGATPAVVRVVHDDVDGRREVARWRRD